MDSQGNSVNYDRPIANKIRLLRLTSRKRIVTLIVLAIVVAGLFVAAYAYHVFAPPVNCWIRPADAPNTAVFTIVMANEGMNVGYNGSAYHAGQDWPQMNVTLGQNVVIHVINNDTAQAHGFQISHYFDQGVGRSGLGPGNCYDVRFVATELGSFMVFCDIFCTIHLSMQSGRLNVS